VDQVWGTFRGWLTFQRLSAERNFDEETLDKIRCTEEMMNTFQRLELQSSLQKQEVHRG